MQFDKEFLAQFPDVNGRFGEYGGRFVSETLMASLLELEQAYAKLKNKWKLSIETGRAKLAEAGVRVTTVDLGTPD